jgi:hypothetical protein
MTARFHLLARLFALGVTIAALAAPAALARPIDGPNEPVRPDPGILEAVVPEPAPAEPPIVRSVDAGFDWGSAAIGAGGAGAIVVLVSLGGVAIAARRRIGVAR